MAEQFALQWLTQNNLTTKFQIISRALTDKYEPPNSSASLQSILVLANDFSIDLRHHRSSILSSQEVDDAQIIIGVTGSHVETIQERFPSSMGKVYTFSTDVPDPWRSSLAAYRECAHRIKPLVYETLDRLLGPAEDKCNQIEYIASSQ